MQQRKVLHIIKGLGRGGAERLLVSTIRQHSAHYRFDIVYFLPWKNQLVADLEKLGCQVTCLSSGNVLVMLFRLPALVRLIKKNKYDLLHGHLPWSGILARMAGSILGVPVVYTEHNSFSKYKSITRFANKHTIEWQQKVIAVSHEVSETLQREVKPKVDVVTILNGVDTTEFDPALFLKHNLRQTLNLPADAVIVGTVAVFRPQKRLDRWIRIADALLEKFDHVHFVIVGDGLLRDDLLRQAAPWVEKKRLTFAGLSDRPEQWMACMDIYLMSSDFEGMPVALLESMSMGCVPVVSQVGGIPMVVDHGVQGFLYPPEAEHEAVEYIIQLLNHPDQRMQLAKRARIKIEAYYSVSKMVVALERVYDELK